LGTVAHAFGVALTLVGGALALLPRPRALPWRRAVAGPVLLPALTLAAVSWGAYGVYAAPELELGASPVTGPVALPALVLPAPRGSPVGTPGPASRARSSASRRSPASPPSAGSCRPGPAPWPRTPRSSRRRWPGSPCGLPAPREADTIGLRHGERSDRRQRRPR